MPWIPDDDPILKELRAWRNELGANESAAAPGAEQGSQAAVPTAVWASQAPTSATPSSSPVEPTRSSEPRRRHGSAHVREPMGPRRVADEMPWFSFGRLTRTETAEQPVIDVPSAPRHDARAVPRHATWNVMSSGPAEPQPIRSAAERELANASTVAFPMVMPEDLADEGSVEFAIQASNLHKRFGEFVAVQDVSFAVPKGKIVALLGPNGAGKTTTVNMLCTLLKPDGGTATVAGCDVAGDAPGCVARSC